MRGLPTSRATSVRWLLLAVVAVALAFATTAGGASNSVVVSATVPSAVSLTNDCRQPAGYSFGTVLPGTAAVTSTGAGACRFSFQSSNDTAMLRMHQRDGDASPAMASMSSNVLDQDGGAGYNSVHEIDMFDDSNGFAAADGGALYQTTDGTTWNAVNTGLTTSFRGVEAAGSSIVIVVGSGGIRRSTTGGTSWTTVHSVSGTIYDIDQAGGRYWAVGDGGTILTSTDGISWSPQASGTTARLESVDAVSGSIALAAGGGTILRYDGTSWSSRTAGSVSAGYEVHAWSPTGLAIATGNWGEIRRSTDGGLSWSAAIFGPSPGMADVGVIHRGALVVSATEAYVSGLRGVIMRSTDSGATWSELPTPTRNFVRSLAANPSGTRFYAAGGGGLIADTLDWSNWNTRRRSSAALFDVTAVDGRRAYAVGAHGFIRSTSDGSTWSTPTSPTSQHLWAVDSTTSGVGYAVGDNGTVLRTDGTTWNAVTATGSHALRGVAAVTDDVVVAVGTGGVVARSGDAGATWTVTTPTAAGLSSVSSHGDRVVAVGTGGTALVSADQGRTWTDRTGAVALAEPLRDVSVASEDVIYAIAKRENASRKSVDGGVTWQTWTGAGWGNGGYSVSAPSEDVAFTTIYSTTITRTLDGGASTSTYNNYTGWLNWAVAAADANTAWAVGEDGGIARTQQLVAINDFGGVNTWGAAAAPSVFGVCLQSVSGATADWSVDAAPPCAPNDGDPWRALPSAPSKVAHTTAAGSNATVTLVWGFRPAADTPPGRYQATAFVEALAPNV